MTWYLYNQTTSTQLSFMTGNIHWVEGAGTSYIEANISPQIKTSDIQVHLGDVILAYHDTTYLFRGKVEKIEDLGDDIGAWRFRAPGLLKRLSSVKMFKTYGAAADIDDTIIPDILIQEGISETNEEILLEELSDCGLTLDSYQAVGTVKQVLADLARIAKYRFYEGYDNATGETRIIWGGYGEASGKFTFERGIDGRILGRTQTLEGMINWVKIRGTMEIIGNREIDGPLGAGYPGNQFTLAEMPEGKVEIINDNAAAAKILYTGGTEEEPNDFWVNRTTKVVTFSAGGNNPAAGDMITYIYDTIRQLEVELKDINSVKTHGAMMEVVEEIQISYGTDITELMKGYLEFFAHPLEEVQVGGIWDDSYKPNSWMVLHDRTRRINQGFFVKVIDIDIPSGLTALKLGETHMTFQEWAAFVEKRAEGMKGIREIVDKTTKSYQLKYSIIPVIETSMLVEYSTDGGTIWKKRELPAQGGGITQAFIDDIITAVKVQVDNSMLFFSPGDDNTTAESSGNVALDNEWIGPPNREVLAGWTWDANTKTLRHEVDMPYTDVPPKNYVGKVLKEFGIFDGNVNGDALEIRVVLRDDQAATKVLTNKMHFDLVLVIQPDQDMVT